MQAKIYKSLTKHDYSEENWAELLFDRLSRHLTADHAPALLGIAWHELFFILRKFSSHHALAVIKTLSGSWCTGRRMHENSKLECVFGCVAKDDWTHYLYCDRLWGIVAVCTGNPRPQLPLDPPALLGIAPINIAALTNVFIAYTVYHDLKVGRRDQVEALLVKARSRHRATRRAGHKHIGILAKQVGDLAVKGFKWNTAALARDSYGPTTS